MKTLASFFLTAVLSASLAAQHEHHHAPQAIAAKLSVHDDPASQTLTVRLGPANLPANTGHMKVAQPPTAYLKIPFDGWLIAYHPRLVDESGNSLPGRLLHHAAFYNTDRPDFLCPNKREHIFGAGGEMNDWPAVPGFGYPVRAGDSILIRSMFHNPTKTSHPSTYLEVRMEYRRSGADAQLKSVYPTWIDVKQCGESSYTLKPGRNFTTGTAIVKYSGILLGLGGHLHDYGQQVRVENATRNETIASLDAKLDSTGHIRSMPIAYFIQRGGYRLNADDQVKVSATYDNPTGHDLPEGAMGIAVGYFLPDDEQQFSGLHSASTAPPSTTP